MGTYYMLECYLPLDWEDAALLRAVPTPDEESSWSIGRRFTTPPVEPIQIEMHENHCDQLTELDNADGLVMTRRLYDALCAAGVDNMDVYQTVIRHPETGFETRDYVIANLIGLVKAVDLSKSKVVGGSSNHLLDTDFEGVSIDEKKTHGFLMFRLAENTSAVLVHQRVKDFLLSKGFDMLTFVEPEKWIG